MMDRQHSCATKPVPTNANTDVATEASTSRDRPTSWRMTPLGCNTCLTQPSFPTSNRPIRSPNLGRCTSFRPSTLPD